MLSAFTSPPNFLSKNEQRFSGENQKLFKKIFRDAIASFYKAKNVSELFYIQTGKFQFKTT